LGVSFVVVVGLHGGDSAKPLCFQDAVNDSCAPSKNKLK